MCVFIIVSTLAPLKIHPYLFQAFKMSMATSYSGWFKDVFPCYTPGCMQMNQNPHKAAAETSLYFYFFAIVFFTLCAPALSLILLTGTTCTSNFIEQHIHTPYINAQRYYTTGSDIDYTT